MEQVVRIVPHANASQRTRMGGNAADRHFIPHPRTRDRAKYQGSSTSAFWRKVLPLFETYYRRVGPTASKLGHRRTAECRTSDVDSRSRDMQKRCGTLSCTQWREVIASRLSATRTVPAGTHKSAFARLTTGAR